MKYSIILLFILITSPLFAQETSFEITQKIENDTLFVKWLPSDFEAFDNLLNYETNVYFLFTDRNQSVSDEELIADGKHLTLNPPKLSDSDLREEDRIYLSAFLEDEQLDENGKKYAFGMALIKNITDQKFQGACSNYISISPYTNGKELKILIKNNDEKIRHTISLSKKLESMLAPEEVDFNLSLDKKKIVDIEWQSKDYQDYYFAYRIEKSVGNEKDFEPLKEKYLPLQSDVTKKDAPDFVRDDSLVQGKWHYYKVNGYDLFGRKQDLGKVKKIYVPKLTNATVYIDTIEAEDRKRNIKYSIINSGKSELNIAKVILLQSEFRDQEYNQVASTEEFEIKDILTIEIDQKTGDSYYYKVAAVSPDEDTTFSTQRYFFTLDQEPPGSVNNLKGECDSTGIVSLSWEAPDDNDIRGYRVYRSNDLKDVYTEKSIELKTQQGFKDTLRLDNLTSAAYYFVTVVDSNYNHSEHSDTIKVVKPDTIPPSSALMTSIKKTDSTINISWERSVSTDLQHSSLLVNVKGKVDTLLSWTPDTLVDSFIDYPSQVKGHLTYFIISEDHSGNIAKSNEISLFYESGIRPPLDSLNGIADRSNKQIVINWPKANYEVFSYDVYRGKSEDNMELVKTIDSQSNLLEFVDRNIYINNTYVYAVKYITEDGVHSIPKYVKVVY